MGNRFLTMYPSIFNVFIEIHEYANKIIFIKIHWMKNICQIVVPMIYQKANNDGLGLNSIYLCVFFLYCHFLMFPLKFIKIHSGGQLNNSACIKTALGEQSRSN